MLIYLLKIMSEMSANFKYIFGNSRILIIALTITVAMTSRFQNRRIKDIEPDSIVFGQQLMNASLTKETDVSFIECVQHCLNYRQCKSINYLQSFLLCELNYEEEDREEIFFISNSKVIFTRKREWQKQKIKSNPNPCEHVLCGVNEVCNRITDYNSDCTLAEECPLVYPNPGFTIVPSSCKTTPGSLCSLMCNETYNSSAADISVYTSRCLPAGKWSILDPHCKLWISDCQTLKSVGYNTSGVYNITVKGKEMEAYCDMDTEGGGWTVVTKRFDGSVGFNKNWNKYKLGFGSIRGEHWLGNEYIHTLTWGRNYEAYFALQSWKRKWYWALYASFYLYSEKHGYIIKFRGYRGNAGEFLNQGGNSGGTIYGMQFSTYDRDNDINMKANKAKAYGGGWWYKRWAYCVLTGTYGTNKFVWMNIGQLRAATIMVRQRP